MSDREIVGFLATVPLFEGWAEPDLTMLANVVRRRTPREGEILWRQGDDAREMAVVVEGRLAATLRGPGDFSSLPQQIKFLMPLEALAGHGLLAA